MTGTTDQSRSFPDFDRRKPISPELLAINNRLDAGDVRMKALEGAIAANTALTQEIADNTKGFVAFQGELERGAHFLCRVAKGIQFVLEQVERHWKKGLMLFLGFYFLTHDFTLPPWFETAVKAVVG